VINYGKQYIDSSDIKAVNKVLKKNFLTQGPEVSRFEKRLKNYFGAKYCSVVSNGTAALHLVGIALNWKPGDIILTSTLSFLASSNCILYAGAKPEFVDINATNYNIDIHQLEKKIRYFKKKSKKVVAIIATDYAGYPCDWEKLREIALKYKLKLINDNCHSLGSKYKNNKNYAAMYANVVTHSYHPVKNITTGEGGAVLSNDRDIIKKIEILRSHGVVRNPKKMFNNHGPWYYEMQQLGFNYRLSDIQCALGISQLKKIDRFVKKRKEIAKIYDKAFSNDKRFIIHKSEKNYYHSYHLYPLQIKFDLLKISKKDLFKKMYNKGITLQVHYIPIHTQPYYKKRFKLKNGTFPISEKFYCNEVSLPVYYSLKKKQIYKVIKYIKEFCN